MTDRLLWYDQQLVTLGGANDPATAAGLCVGFDIIVIPDNSDPSDLAALQADVNVIELAQAISFDLRFFVAIDLSQAEAGVTIAAIKSAYGAHVAGIALYNSNYGVYALGTVDRTQQVAIYNDIASAELAAMFLCIDYRDLIESFADATFNPSGEALPIVPGDYVVLQVNSSGSVPACNAMIYQYLAAQTYKFNRNLQLGTLYQYDSYDTYGIVADQQYWYDLSAYFRDSIVGYGTVSNFGGVGENLVTVFDLASVYATSNNWRYSRLTNQAVEREDGVLLTFGGGTINSGNFSNV